MVNRLTLHPLESFYGTLTVKEPPKESPLLIFFLATPPKLTIEKHNLGSKSNHTLISITKNYVLLRELKFLLPLGTINHKIMVVFCPKFVFSPSCFFTVAKKIQKLKETVHVIY